MCSGALRIETIKTLAVPNDEGNEQRSNTTEKSWKEIGEMGSLGKLRRHTSKEMDCERCDKTIH